MLPFFRASRGKLSGPGDSLLLNISEFVPTPQSLTIIHLYYLESVSLRELSLRHLLMQDIISLFSNT